MRRSLATAGLAAALAALLVGVLAPAAGAHAVLESSDPADGSSVDVAPPQVRLVFSESVGVESGGVQVLDIDGRRVDAGEPELSDGSTTVTIALRDGLPDGPYTVTYRVISADAHPVRGGLVFGVGAGPVGAFDDTELEAGARPWEVVAVVARWLAYVGALLAAGLTWFMASILDDGARRVPYLRLVRIGCGVGAFGIAANLPVQAALATGQGPASLFRDGTLGVVLDNGVWGSALLGVLGLAVMALGATVLPPPVVVAGAALAAGSFLLSGHTVSADPAWVAWTADLTHLLAVAVWFGGLVGLALRLRVPNAPPAGPPDPDTPPDTAHQEQVDAAAAVARFSSTAFVAALAATAAGSALSWAEVRSVDALTSTTYGQLLIAKVALVAVLAALAAYNRFWLVTAVATHRDGSRRRLLLTLRAEVGIIVVVAAITAVLVNVTPARSSAAAAAVAATASADLGDGGVDVIVDPGEAGANEVFVYVYNSLDQLDSTVADLTLEMELPAADLGPIVRDLVALGPGHFHLSGNELSVPGTWTIDVVTRPSRFSEERATVQLEIR